MERIVIAALAAFLAFQGELLAGKRLLPLFGGCAYVWCSAILFFQVVLIGGYYASRWLSHASERNRTLALAGLGLSGLLVLLPSQPAIPWLEQNLQPLVSLFPFAGLSLALFCTTPLLHQRQTDPTDYKIYAWSNAGALAGLITYPLVVEPLIGLKVQSWIWAIGGLLVCVVGLRHAAGVLSGAPPQSAAGRTRWQWWALPALSSATLLATTNQLGYETTAGPLTWALSLALFLGTYVWAFSGNREGTLGVVVLAGLIALAAVQIASPRSPLMLGFLLLGSGATMAACHTWLAATRNAETHRFYLASAVGGAIGSAVVVLVMPRLATRPIEFSVLTLGTLAVAGFLWSSRFLKPLVTTLSVVAIGLALAVGSMAGENDIARGRTLYGCLRVVKQSGREFYSLVSNTTVHGSEDHANPDRGMTYYGQNSGVGQAVRQAQKQSSALEIGVIGLGTGTISRLLRPEDAITYYEINSQVETLARKFFTYLSHPKSRVVIGDGRKCLENETAQPFDLLVLDAFTGDAIPTHLLTQEAGALYLQHLKKECGVLAVHITNAHIDLHPVIEGLAQSMGMIAEPIRTDKVDWVVLRFGKPSSRPKAICWTDDCSSILGVLK